ncbi:MAG: hypothetical protein JWO05_2537 [Gemmatimonadetes bacterium]|nr:hypothetical protein [Gemmatimonadota bacterium]
MGDATPLGGDWYVVEDPHTIEAGRIPRALVRKSGSRSERVADMLVQQRFYEPDCVVFQSARHEDISVACGSRPPVVVLARAYGEWKLEPTGLRRVSAPIVGENGVVREIVEYGVDDLRALAIGGGVALRPVPTYEKVDAAADPEALVNAAGANRLSLVQALLAAGADPNSHNDRNISALMVACGRGDTLMVDVLLAAGASVTPVDKRGKSAADYGDLLNSDAIQRRLAAARARQSP